MKFCLSIILSLQRIVSCSTHDMLYVYFTLPSMAVCLEKAITVLQQLKRLNSKTINDFPTVFREFEVPSINFAGQMHKWQLSQFLQKGVDRAYDSFLSDLALAARFIVVTAKLRIVGHFFSIKQATKSLLIGLVKICDALIGLPSLLAQDLDHKLIEERCRFLVAELECRVSFICISITTIECHNEGQF